MLVGKRVTTITSRHQTWKWVPHNSRWHSFFLYDDGEACKRDELQTPSVRQIGLILLASLKMNNISVACHRYAGRKAHLRISLVASAMDSPFWKDVISKSYRHIKSSRSRSWLQAVLQHHVKRSARGDGASEDAAQHLHDACMPALLACRRRASLFLGPDCVRQMSRLVSNRPNAIPLEFPRPATTDCRRFYRGAKRLRHGAMMGEHGAFFLRCFVAGYRYSACTGAWCMSA